MKVFGKLYYVLLAVIFLGLFFILENAAIVSVIYPFSFAMLFALVWANQKWYIVCPMHFAAAVIVDHSLAGIISALVVNVCLIVPYLAHYFSKKNMKCWEMALFAVLSQIGKIGFAAASGGNGLYFALASALIGGVLTLGFIKLFEAIFVRGFAYHLSATELIAGGILLVGIASGLTPLGIGNFSFLKLIASFLLLAITYCTKNYYSVFVAAIFGLGSLLHGLNPVYFAPILLWSLAISPFKSYRKYFSAVALVLSELLIGFYFKLYYSFTWISILPTIISAAVFVVIPDKLYASVKSIFDLKSDRAAIKNVVNQNRETLHRRLLTLSDVFGEMNTVFRGLVKNNLSEEEVRKLLRDEIISRNCESCPNRARCHRTRQADTLKVLDEVVAIAFEKGKVTLLDMPTYLSSNCERLNGIIASVATLTRQYKSYSNMLSNIDMSKLLIADQLKGISSVMKSLSKDVDTEIAFDGKREQKIVDELMFNDIVCIDAVVYEKNTHAIEVVLVVRSADAEQIKIPNIVGKICKCKMTACDKFASSKPGYVTMVLKTSPKFDCALAIASATKSGSNMSGDAHSAMRLDGDRFMFALCDGMGSGTNAEKTSETAMSLIENFYKAGFDSDIVLSSVNKLLTLQKEERFSALDVCVLDLKSGLGDFIKMGSPCSFVLSKNQCSKVDSGALPLGIVDSVSPVTKKKVIDEGDLILMFTDGISDAFATDGDIEDFIKESYSLNPQNVADKLLQQALSNSNGKAMDDMTVLAIKVFNN